MSEKRSPGAPASATGTRSNSNCGRFSAPGAREQTAAQAIGFADRLAPSRMVLRSFRPLAKGKLKGFASVELPCGRVLVDLPVFTGRDGPWTGLPRKAALESERRQKLDANGQPSFQAVAQWCSRDLADQFSAAIIQLVRATHPSALD